MAKKPVSKRPPRAMIPVYGPPLSTRLRFVNGTTRSFSYTSDIEIPPVEVIADALGNDDKPLPGSFTVTDTQQTNGGGVWTVTFKATFNAQAKTAPTGSRPAKGASPRPKIAGKLKITIRPKSKKTRRTDWTYPNVTYP